IVVCSFTSFHSSMTGLMMGVSFIFEAASIVIYILSLHDALPIFEFPVGAGAEQLPEPVTDTTWGTGLGFRHINTVRGDPSRSGEDRKSTRLNSSHVKISYAVVGLKKKDRQIITSHGSPTSLCCDR